MRFVKVTKPTDSDSFVAWSSQIENRKHLKHFVDYFKQERRGLLSTALGAGDTDFTKGQVAMLDQVLNTFPLLAETETGTGFEPETETDTAEE